MSDEKRAAMEAFNELTPAEAERLALLMEELGEAQQAIGKILRHGYESRHPDGGDTNRQSLERELGDIHVATMLMKDEGDLSMQAMMEHAYVKRVKAGRYLHHNTIEREKQPRVPEVETCPCCKWPKGRCDSDYVCPACGSLR